jgi:uncharacterized protein (DUF58 family)
MRLTPRGVALLVVSVLLLVAGQWGKYPVFLALGGVLLGAVVAAVLVTARGLHVTVTREVYPDRVERGRPALAKLRVRNPAGKRHGAFLASDRAGSGSRTVRVRALTPGGEATYHYELPTEARGRMTAGPLTLHRVDPFGLASNRLSTGETATLWVHPRKYPARALVGGHPRHHHEGTTTDESLRGSVDLRDVREYVIGDEVRHLHWKASARIGRLMVRDYADPEQPRFTLLLDTRGDTFNPTAFEEAVDLAGSLLTASAVAGHHTRLVTSSGVDLPTSGGSLASRRLLDELCQVGQGKGDSLAPEVLSATRNGGGCLTVVTSGSADLAALAVLRGRYSLLVIIDVAPGGAAPAVRGARVLRAEGAGLAVRKWNEMAG